MEDLTFQNYGSSKYMFGDIKGVNEGDIFEDRKTLRRVGIHLALIAGIDGNKHEGSPSIILNGGYIDDLDLGDVIIYTGHGGNNPDSKKQVKDQSWDAPGNKGLLFSETNGLPVRVTRGYKHKSPLSPKKGYRYCGLFSVTNHFEEIGRDGFRICRFKLEKLNRTLEYTQYHIDAEKPEIKELRRIPTTVLRIIRDTKLSIKIKKLYNYTCQICSVQINVRNIKYAEAAHIKPLGIPHNGSDSRENIICLCPNHHVMFDKGVFTILEDYTLLGLEGKLLINKDHLIDSKNLKYHREHIFVNEIN